MPPDDPYQAREHDHLVEPVFAALGEADEDSRRERGGPRRSRAWPLYAALLLVAACIGTCGLL